MAYGTDFNTATLIDMSNVITGDLQTGDPDHYFRVVPKANTDYIYVYIPDRRESLYLYDSTQTQIASTSSSHTTPLAIVNAIELEYFIRVKMYSAGSYTMYVFASVNGVIDGYEAVVGPTIDGDHIEPAHKLTHWMNYADKTAPITSNSQKSSEPEVITYPNQFKPVEDYFNPVLVVTSSQQFAEPIRNDSVVHYRIDGMVRREGSAVSVLLRLYDRQTGLLIGETWSDGAGNYSFNTRLHKDSKYYVIAFDDMENPDLQAVVHDALIPIAQ